MTFNTGFGNFMALRNNGILKILALLLFTMEFFSPALLSSMPCSFNSEEVCFDKENPTNTVLSLLAEEAGGEEEREDKSHKELFHFAGFFFTWHDLRLDSRNDSRPTLFTNLTCIAGRLSLFKLHHVYRI